MKRLSAIFAACAFGAASLATLAAAGMTAIAAHADESLTPEEMREMREVLEKARERSRTPEEVRNILDKRGEKIVLFYEQGVPAENSEDVVSTTAETVIAYSEDNHTMSVWRGDAVSAPKARELGVNSDAYRLRLEIENAEFNNFAQKRAFGSEHSFVQNHDFSKDPDRLACGNTPDHGLLPSGDDCYPYSEAMDSIRTNAQVMFRGVVAESHRPIADFEEGNLVEYIMFKAKESGQPLMGSTVTLPNGATHDVLTGITLKFTSYGTKLATGKQPVTLAQ